jgi:hypothetical protein
LNIIDFENKTSENEDFGEKYVTHWKNEEQ